MGATVYPADIGRKPSVISRRRARKSHDARVKFRRVAGISAFYIAVLGANLYIGAVVVLGNMHTHDRAQQMADSVKTARFTRPLLDGTFCRTIVFDNKSAETVADKVDRCDGSDRGKRGLSFTWGGQ
jgi:hypothetical protein